MKNMMKLLLVILGIMISGQTYGRDQKDYGKMGMKFKANHIFIEAGYIDSNSVSEADMSFKFAPDAKIYDIRGNLIKPWQIPVPSRLYAELDNSGRIKFLRVVAVYKAVKATTSFESSPEAPVVIYELVDSLPYKSIKDIKKIPERRGFFAPIEKSDTLPKLKILPK